MHTELVFADAVCPFSSIVSAPPSYHEREPESSPTTPRQSWVNTLKPETPYSYHHVRAGSSSSVGSSLSAAVLASLSTSGLLHLCVSDTVGTLWACLPFHAVNANINIIVDHQNLTWTTRNFKHTCTMVRDVFSSRERPAREGPEMLIG